MENRTVSRGEIPLIPSSVRAATLQIPCPEKAKGALVKSGVGLTWSGFRPSDDACIYGYLIPSNMFATVVLGYMETIAHEVLKDEALAAEAASLKKRSTMPSKAWRS